MKLCLVCNFQTAEDQDICPRDGSSMVTVGDDPLLGMVVEGRYKIQSVIGQGSAGTVYKAVQELIGREVAIKVLHDYLVSDDEFIKRFRQEAKASSRLSHPNIITIYDFGVIPEGQRPYIAMDLLIGTPLSDLLAQVERIPLDEAIPIFSQVCSALGEAHRQGVVHRDVKPENIVLVERSGQRLFPIVVDFGIARIVEESDAAKITRTGTVCGSPTYMSPEQCTSSKVDHRSDIYSLGVVIYETLTCEVPFHSDELVRVMAMHLSDPPTPLNQVKPGLLFPEALEEAVYRALAKNPDQRFQSMEEFAQALEDSVRVPEGQSKQLIPLKKPKTVEPGPLAQDESLHPHRTQSQEMPQPLRPSSRDLASRAREEFQERGPGVSGSTGAMSSLASGAVGSSIPLQSAASMEEQVAAMRAQQKRHEREESKGGYLKRGDFSKEKYGSNSLMQKVLPLVLGIVGVGVLVLVINTFITPIPGLPPTKINGPIDTTATQKKPFQELIAEAKADFNNGNKDQAIEILTGIVNDATQKEQDKKTAQALMDTIKKSEKDKGRPPKKKKRKMR